MIFRPLTKQQSVSHPSGPSLKPLSLLDRKELEAVI
jgi:hypothetical protein